MVCLGCWKVGSRIRTFKMVGSGSFLLNLGLPLHLFIWSWKLIDLSSPIKVLGTGGYPLKSVVLYLVSVLGLNSPRGSLQIRGWNLANRCALCLKESVDHFLVCCDMAAMVWGLFGVSFSRILRSPGLFLTTFMS